MYFKSNNDATNHSCPPFITLIFAFPQNVYAFGKPKIFCNASYRKIPKVAAFLKV